MLFQWAGQPSSKQVPGLDSPFFQQLFAMGWTALFGGIGLDSPSLFSLAGQP